MAQQREEDTLIYEPIIVPLTAYNPLQQPIRYPHQPMQHQAHQNVDNIANANGIQDQPRIDFPTNTESNQTGLSIKAILFLLISIAFMFFLGSVMASKVAEGMVDLPKTSGDDDLRNKSGGNFAQDAVYVPPAKSHKNRKNRSNVKHHRQHAPAAPNGSRTELPKQLNSKCITPACIEQGSKLMEELDVAYRPCDDFYHYACSNWIDRQPEKPPENVHSVDTVFVDKYISDLTDTLRSDNNPFPELRFLYDECIQPQPNLFINLREMLFRRIQLHFWPFTEKMDITDDEISAQLGKTFAELGVSPLFDLKMTSFGGFAVDKPSKLLLRHFLNSKTNGADALLNNLYLMIKNVSRTRRFKKADTNVTIIEKTLRGAVERSTSHLSDAAMLFNCSSAQVQDLKPLQYINVAKFLANALGNVTLKKSDFIRFPSKEYFDEISKVFPSKHDLLNYIAFRIMLLISPLLTNDSVRTTLASVSYGDYPQFVKPLKLSHICLKFIERFDPNLIPYVSYEKAVVALGGTRNIETLLTALRASFNNGLKKWLGLSSSFRDHFVQGLHNLRWNALMPSTLENSITRETYADGLYTNNPMHPVPHFFYHWIRSAAQKKRQAIFGNQPRWFGGFLTSDPKLVPAYKQLEIPLPVFDLSLLNDSSVFHLQLPRVAPRIYRELYRYLYHEAINFDLERNVHELENYLSEMRTCISKDYAEVTWHPYQTVLNSERASLSALYDVMAVRSALEAYLAIMEQYKGDYRLASAPNITGTQLFFIFYARSMCEKVNSRWASKMLQFGTKHIGWFRVNGVLRHIPEFAKAFECPSSSRMSSTKRCF